MNPVIDVILKRKSVRAYEARDISEEAKGVVLEATLRAPTAGNMMLYSIIEVTDQVAKDTLAETCDHQPFIAKARWVLLFLADYQRWYDYFLRSGVEQLCEQRGEPLRRPEEGDLLLACCDALIAAHTAVLAAESLGIGSCYIGDIMENYEIHRKLFDLPAYALPICLVCFGYPTEQQKTRRRTDRFDRRFIVFEDKYRRLGKDDFAEMFGDIEEGFARMSAKPEGIDNVGQAMYARKFSADFSKEMSRSVRAMLQAWTEG
jgi:FMN reductase (NADPH)/FMN reductase [NAD(P)H]